MRWKCIGWEGVWREAGGLRGLRFRDKACMETCTLRLTSFLFKFNALLLIFDGIGAGLSGWGVQHPQHPPAAALSVSFLLTSNSFIMGIHPLKGPIVKSVQPLIRMSWGEACNPSLQNIPLAQNKPSRGQGCGISLNPGPVLLRPWPNSRLPWCIRVGWACCLCRACQKLWYAVLSTSMDLIITDLMQSFQWHTLILCATKGINLFLHHSSVSMSHSQK